MSAHFARELSSPKVAALAKGGAIALLPVGATEAHGPHLPLSVDVVVAEEVCRRLGARLATPAVIFPAVAYSVTDFAASFTGTVSLSADAARTHLVAVLEGIAKSGFSTVGVINHHLEPAHFKLVHEAARTASERSGATIVVPDHRRPPTGPKLGHEFMHGGSHGGRYETSLMLAAAPGLVDEAVRRSLPEVDVDLPARIREGAKSFAELGAAEAYLGHPAEASSAEGHRLLEVLVDCSLTALQAETDVSAAPEQSPPPLDVRFD